MMRPGAKGETDTGSEAPKDMKLQRRLGRAHPFLLLLLWPIAILGLGAGTWKYLDTLNGLRTPVLPGVNPIVIILIGLCGGFSSVAASGWLVRKNLEAFARETAFGEQPWRTVMLTFSPFVASLIATIGLLHLLYGLDWVITNPLPFGSFLVPQMFLYHTYLPVHERARELVLEAEGARPARVPVSARRSRLTAWVNRLGVASVIGVVILGAWLQWGIPMLARAEPREYGTKTQPGGVAIRLTYGANAGAPAVSPDGRLVAYVRERGFFCTELVLMRTDGRHKRRIGTDLGPSPSLTGPLAWSANGSRILLIGGQGCQIRSWWEGLVGVLANDVWTVDIVTGAARRLRRVDTFVAAVWAPSSQKIAALGLASGPGAAHLWLMDEEGRNRRLVRGLKIPRQPWSVHSWHNGRELVVVGMGKSAGIWSVDAASGRATRLSDIKAYWALPLNERRLVFAAGADASSPSDTRATSIGILEVAAGQPRWVVRQLQGVVSHPVVAGREPVLFFTRHALPSGPGLWSLRLRDAKLRRLTEGERITDVAVNRDATAIFYVAASGKRDTSEEWNRRTAIWHLSLSHG